MKVIYEISDNADDRTNLAMHKYTDDMYFALIHINQLVRAELDNDTINTKEQILDMISDEIFQSKIHEIE